MRTDMGSINNEWAALIGSISIHCDVTKLDKKFMWPVYTEGNSCIPYLGVWTELQSLFQHVYIVAAIGKHCPGIHICAWFYCCRYMVDGLN